jgi:outer membrane receptor protein involved in Fe transport
VVSLADSSTQNYGGTFTFGGGTAPLLDNSGQPILDSGGQPQFSYISSLERYRRTLLFQDEGLSAAQIRALGGGPSQFSLVGGAPFADVGQADLGVFAQDDWRARPNLTLSFGLRYETQNNIAGRGGFAPRFGFAWEPGANGRKKYHTVIRGGNGLFYDRVDAALTLQALRFDGIRRQQFIVRDPSFFPQVPSVSDLAAQGVPQTLRSMDAGLQSPYNIVSSIGVERDLPSRFKVASTFTHSRSVHLLLSRNITAPLPGASSRSGTLPSIYQYESAGVLNGNQIITNVSRSFSGRLSLYGYYAYGRALANTDGPNTFPANQFDLTQEYGRAVTDIRHRFVLGGSYSGPWGYVLSPFVVGRSGAPFNITTGRDLNGDTLFTDRPALAIDPHAPGVVATQFGAFDPNPAPGTPLIPRNYGNGPPLFTLNLRLNKTIGFGGSRSGQGGKRRIAKKQRDSESQAKIDENNYSSIFHTDKSDQRFNLTFSITARNLFNNVNQGAPIGSLSSPAFGTSNWLASSGNPYHPSYGNNRTVQLEVRLGF